MAIAPSDAGPDGRLDPDPAGAAAGAGLPAGLQIEAIPVLSDNYVFLISRGDEAVLVDPAVAEPLIQQLEQRQLTLVAVLQTHHHQDHIGGTPALLRRWPGCRVVAAAADRQRIPFQTDGVSDGDQLSLLGQPIEVLAVPGHTRAHVAYVLRASGDLFCGDTLFGGGCGRLFEGTAEQMWHALQRLTAFPPATRVWCAHEYTAANLRWAWDELLAQADAEPSSSSSPLHEALARRLEQVQERRRRGLPTIPSTVGLERATNLFVRSRNPGELAALRASKDRWRG